MKTSSKVKLRTLLKKLGIKQSNLIIHDFPIRKLNFHRQEILEILVSLRNGCDYDLVLTPSSTDVHQDHQTVTNEVIRAFKGRTILGYDLSLPNKYFQYCHAQIPMILGNSSELSGILKHHNVGEIWEKGSLSNCLNNIKLNYAEHCAAIHAHNEIVTWEKDFNLVIENLRKLSVQS